MIAFYENGSNITLVAILVNNTLLYHKLGIEKYRFLLQKVLTLPDFELLHSKASVDEYKKLNDVIEHITHHLVLGTILVKKLNQFEEDLASTVLLYNPNDMEQSNADLHKTQNYATRYELAIKGMNDGIWDWNILTDEVHYSLQWKNMLGYEDHELENKLQTWERLMHPEDAQQTIKAVEEYLKKETQSLYHLTRFLHKDGSYRLIVCRGYMQLDENGTPVRMVGSHTDVTQIARMEQKLQQQKELFELAITASNEGIWEWDLNKGRIYFSTRWKCMFGYTDDELPNTLETWKNLIFEDDYIHASSLIEDLKNGLRDSFEETQKFKHKNGHVVFVKSKAIKVCDSAGNVTRLVGSHTDISDYINSQNQLLASEEKYRSIIENMDLGMLHVDNDDIIVDVYHKFAEMTGYSKYELLGKKASTLLVSQEDQVSTTDLINERLSKKSSVYERLLRCKDGTEKWVLISGTPEIGKDGNVIGSIGIHLDITERKKTELALVRAKILAEDSSKSREKLLAKVSHEMRTPMQAFMGFVNYLDLQELSSEAKSFSIEIKLAIESLNSLVNDLLDMNTMQQGRLKLVHRPIKMHTAFDNLINYYTRLIPENKNIVLKYSISSNFPRVICVDPFRVQQIAGNLLSNAIKYTDRGTINCIVDWKPKDGANGHVVFKVSDTGIGIPPEQHEHIFNEFYQVGSSSNTAPHDGVGLGLSIVKQLVDAFKGEIYLESQVNQGTTFTVIIPAEKLEDNTTIQLPKSKNIIKETDYEIRVLIAEDNSIIRRLMATYLIEKNFYVDTAINGKEAVEYFTKYDYDFVLLDINMPVLNGYEAAKAIRLAINKSNRLTNTKIVALSASVIQSEAEKKRLHSFDDFIQKPIELPWLAQYLQENFSKNKSNQQNSFNEFEDENALKDNPEKFLLDPELSDDLKLSIARMLVKELDKEAVRFSEFTKNKDIDKLTYHLHSFKSSAGILCMRNTLKLIEEIEHEINLNETITPFGIDKLNQLNQNILSTRNFLLKKLPHA